MYKDFVENTDLQMKIYRQMCRIRAFEDTVYDLVEKGVIKCQVYLCTGQESIPATIAMNLGDNYHAVLGQHRGHGMYLAFGGNEEKLRDELLGDPVWGCSVNAAGGSPCIQDADARIVGHIGLIGDQVPIAVGMACAHLAKNGAEAYESPVVCFLGDGAAEEDYVLGSLGFAGTHKLPLIIVCEDNNLSVLTPKKDRRDWDFIRVCHSFGFSYVADLSDDPEKIFKHLTFVSKHNRWPALLNIRTCRHYWHVGAGTDGPPEQNRLQIFADDVIDNLKEQHIHSNGIEVLKEIKWEEDTYNEDLWYEREEVQEAYDDE